MVGSGLKPLKFLVIAALSGTALSGCDEQQSNAPNTPIAQPAKSKSADIALGSGFDFYVLSLSWSPSYCESEGGNANKQQCATGRPYAFVVHGLWPQNERGYPQDCATQENDVPSATMRSLYDIMPSAGLIRHEWRKHGTCSGLSQSDYFTVLRKARERVNVPGEFDRLSTYRTVDPADVEKSFLAVNPGSGPAGVAVTCDRRYLQEVRICMSKDLSFRTCPEIDQRACRSDRAVMPPVRGG